MIGRSGERGSGISVLALRHDDDDDDDCVSNSPNTNALLFKSTENLAHLLLYTLPMNSYGYIPFLMNTLDTIVGWVIVRLPDVGAGEVQHSRHAPDLPLASVSCPPGSNPPWRG